MEKSKSREYSNRQRSIGLLVVISNISVILIISIHRYQLMIEPFDIGSIGSRPVTGTITNRGRSLAERQSFGFFDDISDENWKIIQKITAEHENHQYPENPIKFHPRDEFKERTDRRFNSYFAWFASNYEPNFSCNAERRLGGNGNGDGPKWICDPHRISRLAAKRKAKDPNHPGCVVYSIGSNGDFSFELGMQNAVGVGVCEFHTFDFGNYASAMPKELQRAHYHRWGLTSKTNKKNSHLSLQETVQTLGHQNLDVIDVFKIDCESCEWTTVKEWLSPEIPMLQQIQVELHEPPTTAIEFFDSLEETGYVRFHKEPNVQYTSGNCVEYAFLKLDTEFFDMRKKIKSKS